MKQVAERAPEDEMARLTTIETTISNQTTSTLLVAAAAAGSAALASLQHYNKTSAIDLVGSPNWATSSCKHTNDHHHDNNKLGRSNEPFDDDGAEQLYVRLSTFWYCFLAFITAIGLLVSLVSNMIIIYLFTGTPSLRRNPSNIIAVNLSLSDLLYCIQWPSVIYCSLTQSTWMLEIDFVCKTFGFITVTTASASVLTVLAMSVERAIVIKYSIYAKSRYTIRSAWLIVVLIWIVSISSSLPPLFGKFNRFTLDPSKTSCTLDYLSGKANFKFYMLVIYIVYWILPGTIISICYIFIIVTFRRSSRSLEQVASRSAPSRASSEFSCRIDPSTSGLNSGSSGDFRAQSRSPMVANQKSCEHPIRRHRLRDSIRLSNFLGNLRRSSAAATARDGQTHKVDDQPMTNATQVTDATVLRSAHDSGTINSNRVLMADGGGRPPPSRRILKRVATVYHQRLTRLMAPQSASDQALERIELAYITRSQTDRPNGTAMMAEDNCPIANERNTANVLETEAPNWQNDERSKLTRANPIRGSNELALKRPSRRRGRAFASQTVRQSQPLPPLVGERRVSLDAASSSPRMAHSLATELAIRRLPLQRPLCDSHRGLVGSSNTTISSEPNPVTATRWHSQSRNPRSALVSRIASQFDRTRSSRRAFAASQPTLRLHNRSKTNYAPPQLIPQPPIETTCHFGNSSAQLSRASMQVRLAKMSFYLILLWLVSWTPIASLTLINLIVKCHLRANALVVFLANTMTKLGPTFDVFIYGISHPKIKRKFIQIIKRLLCLKNGLGEGANCNNVTSLAQHCNPAENHKRSKQRTGPNQDKLSTRTTRSYWEDKF